MLCALCRGDVSKALLQEVERQEYEGLDQGAQFVRLLGPGGEMGQWVEGWGSR